MKQTDPQYKLRLPQALKEKIEQASKANNRSMNAEIVARLDASFAAELSPDEDLPDAESLNATASAAIENMKAIMWKAVVERIIEASKVGLDSVYMGIEEVPGANSERPQHQEIFAKVRQQLEAKGYKVLIHDLNYFEIIWG
ncbi:Arc family DNA-binding protein [Marinobacter sp. CA1]|uniref:Arc family DNA-binding protein n=1 Tax=Marinobacter sp. CA1 TaxID=2817656 RepID=UPI001D06800F|nr:Arc family DNA-binding protein [Marinobacter sp. CA1]UDL03985.1 Arc family DNA-binding protein [Marinobacter sp. CA1]